MFSKIVMSLVAPACFLVFGLTACGQPEASAETEPVLAESQQALLTYTQGLSGLGSTLCLDVLQGVAADRSNVQLYACNGTPAQYWAAPSVGSVGEVRSAVGSNFCLEVAGGIAVPAANVQIYTCNGSLAQQWRRTAAGELRSELNSNLCLDVSGGFTASGTNVQTYTCNSTLAQKWSF